MNELPCGIISGEPIEAYHASDSWGHTKLEVFREKDRGQKRAFMQYVSKTLPQKEYKDHFDIGSAFDCLLLEGDAEFHKRIAILPDDFNGRTNIGKAMLADLRESGKVVLDRDEYALVMAMFAAAKDNPDAVALLSSGTPQLTFRAAFRLFSVQIRPDWWNHDGIVLPKTMQPTGPYMVDVKTAEDLDRFLRNRVDFGYDRQAALYLKVAQHVMADAAGVHVDEIERPAFYFVVVLKTAPVDCIVFRLSDEDIGTAGDEVMEDLVALTKCYENSAWPGLPRGVHMLPTPKKWKGNDIF